MTINFIIDNYFPKLGGEITQNTAVVRFFKQSNYQVRVFPLWGLKDTDYSSFPYPVIPICFLDRHPKQFNEAKLSLILNRIVLIFRGLLKYRELLDCHIIITDLHSSAVIGAILKLFSRKKLIIRFGGNLFHEKGRKSSIEDKYHPIKNLLFSIPAKLAFAAADLIIVNGFDLYLELVRHNVSSSKIRVIDVGIDWPAKSKHEERQDISNTFSFQTKAINNKLILFCGRITPANGPLDFLRIAGRLSNVTAVVVGDGIQLEEMKGQAENLPIPVHFLGSVSHDSVYKLFKLTDLCIFPFHQIGGISHVVPEAMACGCCILTTRTGDLTRLIEDGRSGYFADIDNLDSFADKARLLLDNDRLRREIGVEARKNAKRHKWETVGRNYLNALNSIS
ncbi:glycosyltransferase family 4 protein [candidate division KSB1 bacterium]